MSQAPGLTLLQSYGTLTSYTGPTCGSKTPLTLVSFADSGHSKSVSQLSFITCIAAGPIQRRSILHLLCWSSHEPRGPDCSTGVAEILAAVQALEEVFLLQSARNIMYGTSLSPAILDDTKDLDNSLSSERNSTETFVYGEVDAIPLYFKTSRYTSC